MTELCACTTWGGCRDGRCECDCHKPAAPPAPEPLLPACICMAPDWKRECPIHGDYEHTGNESAPVQPAEAPRKYPACKCGEPAENHDFLWGDCPHKTGKYVANYAEPSAVPAGEPLWARVAPLFIKLVNEYHSEKRDPGCHLCNLATEVEKVAAEAPKPFVPAGEGPDYERERGQSHPRPAALLCEKCNGAGSIEDEGRTFTCPVCDGGGFITYEDHAEYARQIDAAQSRSRLLRELAEKAQGVLEEMGDIVGKELNLRAAALRSVLEEVRKLEGK